jgi:hypothetical protein
MQATGESSLDVIAAMTRFLCLAPQAQRLERVIDNRSMRPWPTIRFFLGGIFSRVRRSHFARVYR